MSGSRGNLRIGAAARRAGVSERSLRYYEAQGLLTPARGEGGQRLYGDRDLVTVGRIRTLLAAGLGTSMIAELLPCMREDGTAVAPACAELVDVLMSERGRLSGAIGELESARATLDSIIAAAPSV